MSALSGEGAQPKDLAGWLACADDLKRRQEELAAERAQLAARRQMFALAAATGDARAQKRIEQLAAREQVVDLNSVSLAQALARAGGEIAAAEAALAVAAHDEASADHERRLAARLTLIATIEQRLREIAPLLTALAEVTRAVTHSHLALGGSNQTLPPLAPEAISGRLAEFMTGIGFADWLPLARPEIRAALASWVDAEALAQESYRVSNGG